MAKKVLIVEDDKSVAEAIARNLEGRRFETKIILYSPNEYIDAEDLELDKDKQDYAIIDSLDGRWKDVAPFIETYNTCPIIFSGNNYVVEAAKEQGFYAFDKPRGLEEIIELMNTRVKP